MNTVELYDLGRASYQPVWDLQTAIQQRLVDEKLARRKEQKLYKPGEESNDVLLFVEHPHVYTLGKSGDKANMLKGMAELADIDAESIEIDRGGDITYHGPGQIVGYPIFDLENLEVSYKGFIEKLENGIITYLKETHNIEAFQLPKATGVWIDTPTGQERIGAIGTRASKYVT